VRRQCYSSCHPSSTAATATVKSFTTRPRNATTTLTTKPFSYQKASLHNTHRHSNGGRPNSDEPPPTDFAAMDVLANTPVPSTAVDICMSEGFQLNSGAKILEGSGVILVGGEAFVWKPWLPRGEHRLLNARGQWEVPNETLGLLSLVWPRPGTLSSFLPSEARG
jgi:hypothetical protein